MQPPQPLFLPRVGVRAQVGTWSWGESNSRTHFWSACTYVFCLFLFPDSVPSLSLCHFVSAFVLNPLFLCNYSSSMLVDLCDHVRCWSCGCAPASVWFRLVVTLCVCVCVCVCSPLGVRIWASSFLPVCLSFFTFVSLSLSL